MKVSDEISDPADITGIPCGGGLVWVQMQICSLFSFLYPALSGKLKAIRQIYEIHWYWKSFVFSAGVQRLLAASAPTLGFEVLLFTQGPLSIANQEGWPTYFNLSALDWHSYVQWAVPLWIVLSPLLSVTPTLNTGKLRTAVAEHFLKKHFGI